MAEAFDERVISTVIARLVTEEIPGMPWDYRIPAKTIRAILTGETPENTPLPVSDAVSNMLIDVKQWLDSGGNATKYYE